MSLLFIRDLVAEDAELQNLLGNPRLDDDRPFVESLWQLYEPYADKHFRSQIARNFHSRFWEMYLACSLMKQGYQLVRKSKAKGPDVCLRVVDSLIWIEAVAASAGKGLDAVPQWEAAEDSAILVPEEKIILRYCSVIRDKHQKYQEYVKDNIISVDDPFVIAVNGARVPFSLNDHEVPFIVKAVLPFGSPTVTVDINTKTIVARGYTYRPAVQKIQPASVSTRLFLEEESAGITGILFSNTDLLNRPTELGKDFVFIHNPLATNPLPKGWLRTGYEYWVEDNELRKARSYPTNQSN